MVIISLPVLAAENTTDFLGGDGTEENPFIISSAAQLNNVRNYLDSSFKIVTDITFLEADFAEGGNFYNGGRGWEPIGNSSTPFRGKIDGNGHSILGLYMNHASADYSGLFGYADVNSEICSINLAEVEIKGGLYTGGIVAYTEGLVNSCSVSGNISTCDMEDQNYAHRRMGGVIGYSSGKSIKSCSNYADISIKEPPSLTYNTIGGVVGRCWNCQLIEQCSNYGNITVINDEYYDYVRVGGIVGLCYNANKIVGCQNSGNIIVNAHYKIIAGGIVGAGNYSSIEKRGSYGDEYLPLDDTSQLTITDCVNYGNVNSKVTSTSSYSSYTCETGGIVGHIYGTTNNSSNYGNVCSELATNSNASYHKPKCTSGGISGFGSVNGCYNIGDIISKSTSQYADYSSGPYSSSYAGGITGVSNGVTESCNSGTVTAVAQNYGFHYCGGIAGSGGNIADSYNTGNLSSYCLNSDGSIEAYSYNGFIGGISGYIDYYAPTAPIKRCYNLGDLSVECYMNAGGIYAAERSGYPDDTVSDCFYNSQSVLNPTVNNGLPLELAQLQEKSTYTSFDFDTIWTFDVFGDYPYPVLQYQVEEISSMAIVNPPDVPYVTIEGTQPDVSSLTVSATFENGETRTASANSDFLSAFDFSRVGLQTYPLVYHGIATDESISILVVQKTPISIEVATLPEKNKYLKNEEAFNPTGGTIFVTYDNGETTTIPLTSDMISGFDNSSDGEIMLTVSYGEATTSFCVEVISRAKITVTKLPEKTRYFMDEQVDAAGGELTLLFSDGSSTTVDLSEAEIAYSKKIGTVSVTVTYFGLQAVFDVSYVEGVSITVSTMPRKMSYVLGQPLNTEGGMLTVTYTDGSTDEIMLSNANCTIREYIVGTSLVDVEYLNMYTSFPIQVINRTVKSVYLISAPKKLTYVVGQKLDFTGSNLQITYESDDDYSEIVPISDNMISNYNNCLIGYQTVQVSVEGLSTSFVVRVSPVLENIVWNEADSRTTITGKCNLGFETPNDVHLIMASYERTGHMTDVAVGSIIGDMVSFTFRGTGRNDNFVLFVLDKSFCPIVNKVAVQIP